MSVIILLIAGISACYWSLALIASIRFFRTTEVGDGPADLPPVSILKPVRGLDEEAYENFRSHCAQDYPVFEILFAVHDSEDPAIEVIERLAREFPNRSIRLVTVPARSAANRKVESLRRLSEEARYDRIVYSDADIRVPPDYLRRLAVPLSKPSVGVVTCPYRAIGPRNIGSLLETLTVNVDFLPAVLVAWIIEGATFALGATIATSRQVLLNIGGFEPLRDFVADDYQVGNRAHKAGLRVVILPLIVDHVLPKMNFAAFWMHQLRWARTVRVCRPLGMFSSIMTHALIWSAASCWAFGGSPMGWVLFGLVYGIRVVAALWLDVRYLKEGTVLRSIFLVPLRDLVGLALWLASFMGNRITWRGETFLLSRDGRMQPLNG